MKYYGPIDNNKDIATKKYTDDHGGGGGGQHILYVEGDNYFLDGTPVSTMEDRDKMVEYANNNTLSGMYSENSTTYTSQAANYRNEMGVDIAFLFIYDGFTIKVWFADSAFHHEKIENGGSGGGSVKDLLLAQLDEWTAQSYNGWAVVKVGDKIYKRASEDPNDWCEATDVPGTSYKWEEQDIQSLLIPTRGGGGVAYHAALSHPTYIYGRGIYSFGEGFATKPEGSASHAEGMCTTAGSDACHAEGYQTTASGMNSHAEGMRTTASGHYGSHSEGQDTTASGMYSHAEGLNTTASNDTSHAEGIGSTAEGAYSHAEGNGTKTTNNNEHAEGSYNISTKLTDGTSTLSTIGMGTDDSGRKNAFEMWSNGKTYFYGIGGFDGTNSVVTNESGEMAFNPDVKDLANALGGGSGGDCNLKEFKDAAHPERIGWGTDSSRNTSGSVGVKSITFGLNNTASNYYSHAEGDTTVASGENSHSEGFHTTASGISAHAEGQNTTASGNYSHAEGERTQATKASAHAEGRDTKATGNYSHAEGGNTEASGANSHAEGNTSKASGVSSHAEGEATTASGTVSHAEGTGAIASNSYSHAEGRSTTATNECEHAQGMYNASHTNTIDSVGIGTRDARKNATETMNDGRHFILGVGGYDGTNPDTARDLAKVINQPEHFEVADVFTSTSDCLLNIANINSNGAIFVSNGIAYVMLYFTKSTSIGTTGWKLMLQWKNTWKYKIDNSFKANCAFRCCGSMWANNAYVNMAFDCYPDIDSGMSTTGIKSYYYNNILNQTGGVNMSLIFPVVLR